MRTAPTHLPLLAGVLLVHDGLHLVPVLHQHDGQVLVGELPHREGEVVRARHAAAEQAGFGVEVPADVDVDGVEGHGHLGPALHAVGARHREGRAQLRVLRQPGQSQRAGGVAQAQQANQSDRREQHGVCGTKAFC